MSGVQSSFNAGASAGPATKLSFVNEGAVTRQDILREAGQIWAEFKKQQILAADLGAIEANYKATCERHSKFNMAYPTVLRHMLQQNMFSLRAFDKYLAKVERSPWTNDASRMDSYADYFVLLVKETSRSHPGLTVLNQIRANYRADLQREHEEFLNTYETNKQKQEELEAVLARERVAEAIGAFGRLAESRGLDPAYAAQIKNRARDGALTFEQLDRINMRLLEAQPVAAATKEGAAAEPSEPSEQSARAAPSLVAAAPSLVAAGVDLGV